MNEDAPIAICTKPENLKNPMEQFLKISLDEKLKIDNKLYSLKIGLDKQNKNIIFYVENNSFISDEFYYSYLDFNAFLSLGRIFKICLNIEEVLKGFLFIHQNINESKSGFNVTLNMKNNNESCIIKYSYLLFTGSEDFEITLSKIEKDKDNIIKSLKNKINDYECNWLNEYYKEEYQNKIIIIFKEIHHISNEIGKKLLEKANENNYLELINKSRKDLSEYINSGYLSKYSNFIFSWKDGGNNYNLENFNKKIIKTGGNASNCTVIGDRIIPKNSINEWKIKIIK